MKILTVADFFYPGVTGGASIVIYEVMRRLVERGHQVTALIRQQPDTPSWVAGMQVCSYVPAASEALYPLSVLRCMGQVRRLLAAQQIDLVNAHHAFSGLAAALALRGCRLPSVFFFTAPGTRKPWPRRGFSPQMAPVRTTFPSGTASGEGRIALCSAIATASWG